MATILVPRMTAKHLQRIMEHLKLPGNYWIQKDNAPKARHRGRFENKYFYGPDKDSIVNQIHPWINSDIITLLEARDEILEMIEARSNSFVHHLSSWMRNTDRPPLYGGRQLISVTGRERYSRISESKKSVWIYLRIEIKDANDEDFDVDGKTENFSVEVPISLINNFNKKAADKFLKGWYFGLAQKSRGNIIEEQTKFKNEITTKFKQYRKWLGKTKS